MSKTIHRPEYRALIELLRQRREEAGLTQAQCSKAMNRTQSFMSDVENGSRRLDVIQLFDLCDALDVDVGDAITRVQAVRTSTKKKRNR
ncbi:MAG: helix-turn-helix transcriptional regulator [Steroidobacter sp.]